VLLALLTPACGLPKDPDGTSKRIAATHVIRVGVTDDPPWTAVSDGEPEGIEPRSVQAFAESLNAKVVWMRGSETGLVHALKSHELDLVIGGFEEKTAWASTAGLTQPFAKGPDKRPHVMLAPPGENGFILALDRFLAGHKEGQ
jgi:ABC-type amino acid transport substrate-binding protein